MNASEVIDAFRTEVVDTAEPYFWSATEVWRYLNDAYRMFVRLTGGVADFTSSAASVPIITGDPIGVLDKSILRIMSASRRSDGGEIEIVNHTDLGKQVSRDYGVVSSLRLDNTVGMVRFGVIGMQRDIIRWIHVPAEDDVAELVIRRLPLSTLVDDSDELSDVEEAHHIALLLWMKYLAYSKQDADTYDKDRWMESKALFEGYCSIAKAEAERYKHKNRAVAYGGL